MQEAIEIGYQAFLFQTAVRSSGRFERFLRMAGPNW